MHFKQRIGARACTWEWGNSLYTHYAYKPYEPWWGPSRPGAWSFVVLDSEWCSSRVRVVRDAPPVWANRGLLAPIERIALEAIGSNPLIPVNFSSLHAHPLKRAIWTMPCRAVAPSLLPPIAGMRVAG